MYHHRHYTYKDVFDVTGHYEKRKLSVII